MSSVLGWAPVSRSVALRARACSLESFHSVAARAISALSAALKEIGGRYQSVVSMR
ncbi:hypothetical protein [Arthrobacter sp. JCM 19049]|uniref:hypothetical protein n=1 Tax=Arthrobacter sp. JCM 19049 TaxID=1460643 RepID=UPI0035B559BC